MSDSGIPRSPAPKLPGQSGPVPAQEPEPNARLEKLPPELQDVRKPVHLKGEVTQVNRDGSYRVHTDRGDIEVRPDPGTPPPAKGEEVEIDIPPGKPPQTARVTVAEETPPRTDLPPPPPEPRPSRTPVEIDVRPLPETTPAKPVEKPLPQGVPDYPVQVQQIAPEQILPLLEEPVETVTKILQQLPAATAKIIAQAIQNPAPPPVLHVSAAVQTTPPKITTPVLPESAIPIPPDTDFPLIPIPIIPPPIGRGKGLSAEALAKAEGGVSSPSLLLTPDTLTPPSPSGRGSLTELPSLAAQNLQPLPDGTPPILFTARIISVAPPETGISIRAALKTVPQKFFQRLIGKSLPALETKIATPPLQQNRKPGTLMATVIERTPQEFPVLSVKTPQGQEDFFVLLAPAPQLATGTQITLLPQDSPATAPHIAATVVPPPLAFLTPEPWPLLEEIYTVLSDAAPAVARAFTNVVPSPASPAQLSPMALFFIAAVRGGDLTEWLGDKATDALRRAGRMGLVSRLGAEGSALNRLLSQPVSSEWRGVSLPLYWENDIHKLVLYYKQDTYGEKDAPEKGKQVRFVFDLALDNMGKVQLDGLFRAKRLDLIVRSEQAFSQPMQMDMRRAYINALEQTDVSGELSFQNKPEQWVTIRKDTKSEKWEV